MGNASLRNPTEAYRNRNGNRKRNRKRKPKAIENCQVGVLHLLVPLGSATFLQLKLNPHQHPSMSSGNRELNTGSNFRTINTAEDVDLEHPAAADANHVSNDVGTEQQ